MVQYNLHECLRRISLCLWWCVFTLQCRLSLPNFASTMAALLIYQKNLYNVNAVGELLIWYCVNLLCHCPNFIMCCAHAHTHLHTHVHHTSRTPYIPYTHMHTHTHTHTHTHKHNQFGTCVVTASFLWYTKDRILQQLQETAQIKA